MKIAIQALRLSLYFNCAKGLRNSPSFLFNSQVCYSSVQKPTMRAIKQKEYGGPETMFVANDVAKPTPGNNQVLVEVHGSAVNRADLVMCKGSYPGQKKDEEPGILGLEMSGIVKGIGAASTKWRIGDRVMGLLPGTGYADYCVINENHLMPVLEMTLSEAGGLPEVWLTAYQLLHFVGKVKPGDTVLIHGGGSGVGTAAVQLVRLAGAVPIVTAGSKDKINKAVSLGAVAGFNYKDGEFSPGVKEKTKGAGANLILDCVGGSFWKQNIACLAFEGTWVSFGLLGGGNIDGNLLSQLLGKRGTLVSTTLKSRSDDYKAELISEFTKNALPYFDKPAIVDGKKIILETVVDTEFPIESVVEAHQYIAQNRNIGKVLLKIK